MAWYRCRVCGENFPRFERGDLQLFGFVAMRCVEAASPEEAEHLALLDVSAGLDMSMGAPGADRARISCEEIVELDAPEPNTGFEFFPMKDAD